MRKLKHFIATSLDGYIATPTGGVDWLFHDQDYGYSEFIAGIDTVIMGRKTYETSISFGEDVYPGKKAYVFSRTRPISHNRNYTFVVEQKPADFVKQLLAEPGLDVWLVGGGEITRELLDAGLIDHFVVSVHPVLLGDGIPLFPRGFARTQLKHTRTIPYSTGLVQSHYDRA